ncbi:MAG: archaeal proteasome endopeptidase complex subunit alpha [Candidatus Pacearchaeota archaeon]|nr:MAG: archaeal proteasome endopeptidase complex subunit alpha [Candidatus Pacearchaeota archaeon]
MEMEMQHRVMGYDRAATMFSPDGRILQVEYAEKTVRLGSASVGLVCSDGIMIISDKRLGDPLVLPEAILKIWEIDEHIIATAAGVLSDARVLLEHSQVIAQQHRVTYDQPIDTESVIKDVANIQQSATQYAGARPFGIAVMIAGINRDNAKKLYVSDVTGNYLGFKASVIGENDDRIKELLQKGYKESLSVDQGIKFTLNIFKKVLGKGFNIERFETVFVKTDDKKAKRLHGAALSKYVR